MIDISGFLDRYSAKRLRARSFTVLHPGERIPQALYRTDDARGFLRMCGLLVFADMSELVRVLGKTGYNVFRATPVEQPVPGTYIPDPHRAPLTLARHLRCALGDTVIYAIEPAGPDITVDAKSWHRWVGRTRARRVEG